MSQTAVRSWYQGSPPIADPRLVGEIVTAALSGIPYGTPPLAAEPVMASRAHYLELMGATSRLLQLHLEAVTHLGETRADQLAALKADSRDFPRFTANGAFEIQHSTDIARADVIVTKDGPKFLELNVGGGVNGMVQFELLRRVWENLRRQAAAPPAISGDPFASYADLIKRCCAQLGRVGDPSHVLIVGSADDPGMSATYYEAQIRILQEHGVTARFVALKDLDGELAAPGRHRGGTPLGVVQFHEHEANVLGWDVSPLVRAIGQGMVGIPSQSSRLLDSKKILALLSEGLPWMSARDRDLVQRFVPWTRVVADRRVEWRRTRTELPRLLLDRPDLFVLKGAAGLSSQEVFFGANMPGADWAALVAEAVATEYYVVQETVVAERLPVQIITDDLGRTETVLANPVVSPFVIGGIPTGCHFRFDRKEGVGSVARVSGAVIGCLLGAPY